MHSLQLPAPLVDYLVADYLDRMALPVFPDQNLASFIKGFVAELEEDFQSPTISKFQDYMPKCRAGLQQMEEVRFGWIAMLV